MKEILTLIFFAAKIYEESNLYDHASMAYLKAYTLWLVVIDMLRLQDLASSEQIMMKEIIKQLNEEDNSWFKKVAEKTSFVIMLSNGQAQRQAREKFHLRDTADFPNNDFSFDTERMWHKRLTKIYKDQDREELSNDITFWQSSYLGQQLIAIHNWAYTTSRIILEKPAPSPIKNYRLPVYTTRSQILSSWINGRERLGQANLMHQYAERKIIGACKLKRANKIYDNLNEKYNNAHKQNNSELEKEVAFYIVSAKGVYNFNTALHYMRILTDNNQDITMPPTAFVMLHLWRLLYGLVEYEKNEPSRGNIDYQQARLVVRNKLTKYISDETPTTHLNLDYVAHETIRQMQVLINLGNLSSTSRLNILQNKFYLDDDYEDPGFHLDWTMGQMLIPSAIMAIKWVDKDMEKIKSSE